MTDPADLAILGGGPAGYAAALRAARRGLRPVLVEEGDLGGVCLNRGCIPTKAMLHVTGLAVAVREAAGAGLRVSDVEVDLPALVARRDEVVLQLRRGVEGLVRRARVEVVRGRGWVVPDGVAVSAPDGEQHIPAAHVLVATGSRAARPPLPGADLPGVIDSDGALALDALPGRLVIAGAGPVGCEWASVFAAAGSQVTVLEAAERPLPLEDADLGRTLGAALARQGVTVLTNAPLDAVTPADGALQVAVADGEPLVADRVLLALGRVPATEWLGLEEAGVALDERGYVRVDQRLLTTNPAVSAAGDVTGIRPLAHVATHQAEVVVDRLAGLDVVAEYETVPSVTYTDPEVASVGLGEEAARQAGHDVLVARFPLAALGRAIAVGADGGFVKVVAERALRRVLGVHAIGPHAGEVIAEGALAVGLEATLDDLAATVHAHPTFAEAVREAALAGLGLPLHVPAVEPSGAPL